MYNVSGWAWGSYLAHFNNYIAMTGSHFLTKTPSYLYPFPDTGTKALYKIEAQNGFYTTQKVFNSRGETLYAITYQGEKVFIKAIDVTAASVRSFTKGEFITNKETTLFSSYGFAYGRLLKVPKGLKLTSSSKVGEWYKVSIGGKTGYIAGEDLEKYIAPAPVPAQTPTALPTSAPSPTPAPPTSAPESATQEPQAEQAPVNTEPVLTETAISGKTYVNISNLNLRKSANASSDVLLVIPSAKFVFPSHGVSNGWYKVTYNGKNWLCNRPLYKRSNNW
jgi:mannosyl-glycoprotein endo-beta-N-acetylglucosaminidase